MLNIDILETMKMIRIVYKEGGTVLGIDELGAPEKPYGSMIVTFDKYEDWCDFFVQDSWLARAVLAFVSDSAANTERRVTAGWYASHLIRSTYHDLNEKERMVFDKVKGWLEEISEAIKE
jgi:hypothetical protein